MSMTADERREWAHDRLNNYLREVEISEFLNVLDAANGQFQDELEEMGRDWNDLNERINEVDDTTGRILDVVADLDTRVGNVEEGLDSLAS